MLKRELKINFKSFLIWTSILVFVFLIVFLMYPSIINSENAKMLDEMFKVFPEEVLKAFNLDLGSMRSAFGWFKTEGFVFVLLITGCYSAILGSNILLKEESDKTIEYLNSLPISRTRITISKIMTGIFYIFLLVITLLIFNFIGLYLSGEIEKKIFLMLSITPLFSSSVIFAFCMFLSTFFNKSKKMIGISLGVVFISYILQTFSTISESVEFLKYFSVFTLSDIRNVITNVSINPAMVILSLILTIIFLGLTIIRYEKKEFV